MHSVWHVLKSMLGIGKGAEWDVTYRYFCRLGEGAVCRAIAAAEDRSHSRRACSSGKAGSELHSADGDKCRVGQPLTRAAASGLAAIFTAVF